MSSVRGILIAALKDVEVANVPDDLREAAFSKAFDLRAGEAVPATPQPPAATRSGAPAPGVITPAEDDLLSNIASRLDIDPTTVEEVFTVHNGNLELITPVGKLSTKTATATKEIAVLIAGGRQAAGLDEWTSWDRIREVCADFKKLDSGNFAKTIREMDDVFNFRKESERKTLVRLAKPGWERVTVAVRRLGGE